ncbi:DUF1294 domain-containing protein [Bacillus massiliigorillae]|uniref:DUF1294 domain-containing protein n=1 Tax=Bacillus massiliigorillae TaxID=1243664 RepID=UPI0003A96032|nr:DUF1294 domain-containing protein [Bacillus massiliigorillae]
MLFVLYYFGVINIIGLTIMGVDKKKARKGQYRISEATLWSVAFIGGAIGATVGMFYFRHKTKHLNFKVGLPILALIDLVILLQLV